LCNIPGKLSLSILYAHPPSQIEAPILLILGILLLSSTPALPQHGPKASHHRCQKKRLGQPCASLHAPDHSILSASFGEGKSSLREKSLEPMTDRRRRIATPYCQNYHHRELKCYRYHQTLF